MRAQVTGHPRGEVAVGREIAVRGDRSSIEREVDGTSHATLGEQRTVGVERKVDGAEVVGQEEALRLSRARLPVAALQPPLWAHRKVLQDFGIAALDPAERLRVLDAELIDDRVEPLRSRARVVRVALDHQYVIRDVRRDIEGTGRRDRLRETVAHDPRSRRHGAEVRQRQARGKVRGRTDEPDRERIAMRAEARDTRSPPGAVVLCADDVARVCDRVGARSSSGERARSIECLNASAVTGPPEGGEKR